MQLCHEEGISCCTILATKQKALALANCLGLPTEEQGKEIGSGGVVGEESNVEEGVMPRLSTEETGTLRVEEINKKRSEESGMPRMEETDEKTSQETGTLRVEDTNEKRSSPEHTGVGEAVGQGGGKAGGKTGVKGKGNNVKRRMKYPLRNHKKSSTRGIQYIDTQELLQELSEVEKMSKRLGVGTMAKSV